MPGCGTGYLPSVMASGASLWACSNMVSGFVVGRSEDDGATFTPQLKLSGIRGPIGCAPQSTSQRCVDSWPALRDQLAGTGSQDAGKDAGTPAAPIESGGRCSSGSGNVGGGAALGGVSLALVLATLRKRARGRARSGR